MESNAATIELIHRVLRDSQFGMVDAAVLYGETVENEMYQLRTLSEMTLSMMARQITMSRFGGEEKGIIKVSGFERWKNILIKNLGVSEGNICSFPLATELPPCTDAEARGLVRFAKQQGWRSVAIVVPPLHAVRAFVSTVSPAMREYPELKIYSYPCKTPSWTEKVPCFQNMPADARANFIPNEFEKMERYYQKGDHLSPKEILEYMNRRDSES